MPCHQSLSCCCFCLPFAVRSQRTGFRISLTRHQIGIHCQWINMIPAETDKYVLRMWSFLTRRHTAWRWRWRRRYWKSSSTNEKRISWSRSLRFHFIWMEDLKRHLALKSIFIRFEFPNPIKRRNGTQRQPANQNEWQMWCRACDRWQPHSFSSTDSWIRGFCGETKIRRTNSKRFQLQDDVDHVPSLYL